MATDPRTIDLLLERTAAAGAMATRKMFGEYGLYCDGVFIGVVCDDRLHLKPTKPGLTLAPGLEMQPAYPGAKPSLVVPAERWDEEDWFIPLLTATRDALSKGRKPRT